ncbi:putative non-F420 flavinoid oxidoreductase [Nocardioides massiliensis]|uniref:Non-F420 flavinoid oxidoreductase n=3 Tax=Nocardioides massiliensis TaxID=1325935 RepID=A0ABT9NIG1_9ACTN|nr:TIGR03885 family FMN-dependent LLM class oxidoreductase [Nocardioides massiliensis]MDP9820206.1 putative non-F420 flavinoid oxidoreductase [Nocardioides massiliensis]
MTVLGFHASHEQIDPRTLLADLRRAEEVGFDAGMCSDHFAPWSERQGQSGFAWSWLGAALEATRLPLGVVNAPGQRYHPAIIAQAAATLTQMYPGRLWVALGSGQALNEHITGDPWPPKAQRNERLRQSAETMRALLAGEEVSVDDAVRVDRARLWTLPEAPPPLLAAAVSPATAAWAAHWADGLATINQGPDRMREVLDSYRRAGGRGPAVLQLHLSLAPTYDEALAIAHDQWRTNVFEPDLMWDLESPERFDAIGEHVATETVAESVLVDDDPARLAERIADLARLGFDQVMLHHVGQDQGHFLTQAGETLLPRLREALG